MSSLIDRYLNEVGRYLPPKNREDILAELRSLLNDTLEGRIQDEPGEEDIVSLLKELGPPQKVAASYAPEGQYLIGPALYPLFWMIAGIVLAAVIGAQLVAFGVAVGIGGEPIDPLQTLLGILGSIPSAFGTLVIVFAILQWFDVRPETDSQPWDPRSLPEIEDEERVQRGERIAGIAAASVLLAILNIFPGMIGVYVLPEGEFFANPVLREYLGWISLALLAGIGLDLYVLWQGRWTTASRVARLAVNLLSIGVLAATLQGHSAWLAANGAGGFLESLQGLDAAGALDWQVAGMQAYRLAFGVALVVTLIEAGVQAFRMIRRVLRGRPGLGPAVPG